jgi:hypothetical protein
MNGTWGWQSRLLVCTIVALSVTIGVFALITTAPAAGNELLFGEAVG